jgi:hypothetical protein
MNARPYTYNLDHFQRLQNAKHLSNRDRSSEVGRCLRICSLNLPENPAPKTHAPKHLLNACQSN